MGQAETPEQWRVERPACCRDVEAKGLDTSYGDRADFECPDCGAGYYWSGAMASAPESEDDEERDDGEAGLEAFADGGGS